MGILTRYIVREVLKLLFPVWLALGFLLFILEWLAQVFNVDGEAWDVILLYLYKLPSHLVLIFPAASLFAVLVVVGGMTKNRENVASMSIGYKPQDLLRSVFIALTLASIPYYSVVDFFAPRGIKAHFEHHDIKIKGGESRFQKIKQEKIWYRNQDVLYNVGFFDPFKQELFDVMLYSFDDNFHIAQTIYARSATWIEDHWLLKDGRITLSDSKLSRPVLQSFQQRSTQMIESPRELQTGDFSPETMSQSELREAINRYRSLGINAAQWETTYHSRFSFFMISFVLVLLAFPRALKFRRGQSGARDGIFVATVSLAYWILFNFGKNMGLEGKIDPVLASWGPSVIFIIVYLIFYRLHYSRLS